MDRLDRKIREYVDKFHTNVPLFVMPPVTDDELEALIDECLETGKPIEVDVDPNVFY